MTEKTEKNLLFEVRLNWLADTRGLLCAPDAKGTIHVATPPVFGGVGKPWTPEHYFLSSISSCFMTTFLALSRKSNFEIVDLICRVTGKVAIVEGKYKFTQIDVYPKIYINSEPERQKATFILEKTHKYCLISNSVNANINYHDEVLVASGILYPELCSEAEEVV
jgi:peroxiredoxin-like protein